jgi:hypothetical protein
MAAGLDKVAAEIAAIKDAPIPMFDLLPCTSGFPSMEHLTLPTLAIDGNPIQFMFERNELLCHFI